MSGHSSDGTDHEPVTDIVSNGGRDADGSARILSRWTFQYSPARSFVEKRLEGRVLNACAGQTILNHDGEIVRNDLNPDREADTQHDVAEIADHFPGESFDTVVFDPPFDEKQAQTKYDGLHAKNVYSALTQFNELVRPGGFVLCFGWNSWGMRSFGAFDRVNTASRIGGPIRPVHLDSDCRFLDEAKNQFSGAARQLHSDRPICKECSGTAEHGNKGGSDPAATQKQLADLDPDDVGLSALGERPGGDR
jgi:hypothetical protein